MPAVDRTSTLLGAAVKVAGLALVFQPDGRLAIQVNGETVTDKGERVNLGAAQGVVDASSEQMAPALAFALRCLRAANGLEAGPDPLKPPVIAPVPDLTPDAAPAVTVTPEAAPEVH